MKQNPFVICGLALSIASSAHAGLQITNGDFQTSAPSSGAQGDVVGWFNLNGGANWWMGAWYGPQASPTGSSDLGLSAATLPSWAYQSIGINDGGFTSLSLSFDLGSFTDAGATRDLGLTVSLYQSASFIGADNTDIEGASGVTLLDSVSLTRSLAPGQVSSELVTLSLAAANTADPVYLRFSNFKPGATDPWLAVDNVQIVPEPSTFALAGLGVLGLLFRRKQAR